MAKKLNPEPDAGCKTSGVKQVANIRDAIMNKIITGDLACSIDYEDDDTTVRLLVYPCGAYITPSKKLIILVNMTIEQNEGFFEDAPTILDIVKESVTITLSSEIEDIYRYVDKIRMIPDEEPSPPEDNDLTTTMAQTLRTMAATIKMMKEDEIFSNLEEDNEKDEYKKDHTIMVEYIR